MDREAQRSSNTHFLIALYFSLCTNLGQNTTTSQQPSSSPSYVPFLPFSSSSREQAHPLVGLETIIQNVGRETPRRGAGGRHHLHQNTPRAAVQIWPARGLWRPYHQRKFPLPAWSFSCSRSELPFYQGHPMASIVLPWLDLPFSNPPPTPTAPT